jgi:hypothetical protein
MATLMYIDAASMSLAIQFVVILVIVILVGWNAVGPRRPCPPVP